MKIFHGDSTYFPEVKQTRHMFLALISQACPTQSEGNFIFCKTKTKKQIPENCIGVYFYPSPFQMVIYGILRVFNQILGTNVANKGYIT